MAATYTYNPADITANTHSRARFELGDILVDGGAETCYLSDEEINAIITAEPRWKRALFRLADAVCMRLSYETDWRDDGTAFNLNQRAERWQKLRDRLEQEADAEGGLPESGAVRDSLRSADGGHYFHRGMNNSPFVQPPYLYGGDR